jgi:hypothetical protein
MDIEKLNADKPIAGLNGLTVGDFWSWAYSDILSNGNRSVFAEFLVGTALGVTQKPRIEWNAVDLYFGSKKVEVKSAAYLQSWEQKSNSVIKFDIGMKNSWDSLTNIYLKAPVRSADCYVFCLYAEKQMAQVNILDVTHWQFFVLLTENVNQEFGGQKSVRLSRIQRLCQPVDYYNLKHCVEQLLGTS